MATQVQIRRGTTAQHASFTGAAAELTFDSDLKTVRAHDGSTAGGIVLSKTNDLTTANVNEVTNLYFTDARAREAVSATGSINYNNTTGVFSFTQGNTDTIVEGVTNLFFTVGRANTVIDNRVTKAYIDNLDVDADTLDGNDSTFFAPVNSPNLSGTPLSPTAAAGTSNTMIATTAFVATAVANIVDTAPETLNTLNELAAALGDDPNFATTTATLIGTANNQANAAFAAANVAIVNAGIAFASGNTKVATVAGVSNTSISNAVLLTGVVSADAFSLLPAVFNQTDITEATAVFAFDKTIYRAAELLFTVTNGDAYKVVKTLVIHDGSNLTFGDNYLDDNEVTIGVINTVYSFNISGNNVQLIITPTSGSSSVRGKVNLITV